MSIRDEMTLIRWSLGLSFYCYCFENYIVVYMVLVQKFANWKVWIPVRPSVEFLSLYQNKVQFIITWKNCEVIWLKQAALYVEAALHVIAFAVMLLSPVYTEICWKIQIRI